MVIGSSILASAKEAFVWDETHGMRSLRDELVNDFGLGTSLNGWTLDSANGISADGRFIVGEGRNPNGDAEAWIAHLVTESMLPGDANHDRRVDRSDLAILARNLGRAGGAIWSEGDFDGNGIVSLADLAILQRHFGEDAPLPDAALSPANQPEPDAHVLALLGCAMTIVIRRGRRSNT